MSGFKKILETHKGAKEHAAEEVAPPSPAPASETPVVEVPKQKRRNDKPPEPPRKRGRPSGKRSDSEFTQITAYIRKDTHRAVQLILIGTGDERDFSDLVEELVSKWLKSRT